MKSKACVFLLTFVLMTGGCGYRFSGGGEFPFRIKTIFVPVFENNSSETGIETVVTNDFIYEFTRNRQVSVVEKETADAVFRGQISSLRTSTIARTGTQSPLERMVRMSLNLRLMDRNGKILWAIREYSDDETYEVAGSDKFTTEKNKRNAIKTLSRRMAEMIQYQLTGID